MGRAASGRLEQIVINFYKVIMNTNICINDVNAALDMPVLIASACDSRKRTSKTLHYIADNIHPYLTTFKDKNGKTTTSDHIKSDAVKSYNSFDL